MDATPPQRPFTVDEFHRLGEAGVLGSQERVELFDGRVVEMVPIGSRHAACVRRLDRLLGALVGGDLIVDTQNPVWLDEHRELIPDLLVLEQRGDLYATAHPRPADVRLVIEVADTTVHYDRDLKIPRYGAAGIRESWLVDVQNGVIEVFRAPSPRSGYSDSVRFSSGESFKSPCIGGTPVAVDDVFGHR